MNNVGVADDGGFDGFLQAGEEALAGEGGEEVGGDQTARGMVEAADEVFAGGEIDAGFAADGAIDLGEEGGGDLDEGDAAHVDGGEEAGDVADDAAPPKAMRRASRSAPCWASCSASDSTAARRLCFSPDGQKEDGGGLSFRKRGSDLFAPELPDVGGGDEEGAVRLGWFALRCGELMQAGVEGWRGGLWPMVIE